MYHVEGAGRRIKGLRAGGAQSSLRICATTKEETQDKTELKTTGGGIALAVVSAAIVAFIAPMEAQTVEWRGLVVAPEHRCSPYDQEDYRYPQSVELQIIEALGGVYGAYTGRWFSSRRETDIEHIVARSEAHDSGLCAADRATRRRFASDVLNLALAAPDVNRREKGAKDAAEWLPPLNQCWFAARGIAVRQKYGLTIDVAEARAVEGVFSGCSSVGLVVVPRR